MVKLFFTDPAYPAAMQPAPVFGRRTASSPMPPRVTPPRVGQAHLAQASEHAAFFAAARAEAAEAPRERVVPRSFRAALLAGLVVGCCLAGLDATRAPATIQALSGGLLSDDKATRLVPLIILLGLWGGARAAATSLLVAHAVLRRLGTTSHLAYAAGGAIVATAFSCLAAAVVQAGLLGAESMPTHGLALDAAAGAGAGFFYRVFAGAAPLDGIRQTA